LKKYFKKISLIEIRNLVRNIFAKLGFLRALRKSKLWRIKNRNIYREFHQNAMNAFWEVERICKLNDIKIWPEFGTILGIIRENGPIEHDLDLDFGVLYDKSVQEKIRGEFISNGFNLMTTCTLDNNKRLVSEKYNFLNIDIDIYYFNEESGKFVVYDLESESGKSIEEELDEIGTIHPYRNLFTKFTLEDYPFQDNLILMPSNKEEHLVELYGEDYLIPNPKWDNKMRKDRFLSKEENMIVEVKRN